MVSPFDIFATSDAAEVAALPRAPRIGDRLVWLGYETAEFLTGEVEWLAETFCDWLPLHWELTSQTGMVVYAEEGGEAGFWLPTIDTAFDYLVCLHEIAHATQRNEDLWVGLVEERDADATAGEHLLEEEALCWVWAIANASIPLPAADLACAMACLATYEEEIEYEEGPGWRRGPARRALVALYADARSAACGALIPPVCVPR